MKKRYLSKSRFKLANECPTKLNYTGNAEYENTLDENSFLKALAEGGFQVGELAKLYYPKGIEISEKISEKAFLQTQELLKQENVILFEPAFIFENLVVRVDILVKNGNAIQLIEVKAKSYCNETENVFYDKKLLKKNIFKIRSEWEPYLLDVAFQKYVILKCKPIWKVEAYLLLADKNAEATVNGLNQNFLIRKNLEGRTEVVTKENLSETKLGAKLLTLVPVNNEIENLYKNKYTFEKEFLSFEKYVETLALHYEQNIPIKPILSKECKTCEFKQLKTNLKSGFNECWLQHTFAQNLSRPKVFDVWFFKNSQELINNGVLFMDEMTEADFNIKEREKDSGLSTTERQWLQVCKTKEQDSKPFIDIHELQSEMLKWVFPLNFIDFETTMVAIPFHAGRRPYEQTAFQFSHHVLESNGKLVHKNQYIHWEKGKYPNFEFLRALKKALSENEGTVLRYAAHENTVLCQIRAQLLYSNEQDKDELINWIESIATPTDKTVEKWKPKRPMVDLCNLVKRFYYHPATGGSNSIKKVLPAILESSSYLKTIYSKPAYGTLDMPSLNFKDWQWLKVNTDGTTVDPYKLLPPIFTDLSYNEMETLITDESIADGGAAMTAYARMQFSEMSEKEREAVIAALFKYCELDTLAMVMIVQHWENEIKQASKNKDAA